MLDYEILEGDEAFELWNELQDWYPVEETKLASLLANGDGSMMGWVPKSAICLSSSGHIYVDKSMAIKNGWTDGNVVVHRKLPL